MRAAWTALVLAMTVTTTTAQAAKPRKSRPAPPPAPVVVEPPPPAPPPAPPPPVKVASLAVLPLRAEGLQLNEANRLNLMLRARALNRGTYAVQADELTTQLVDASQGLGIDCDLNALACAIELGKLADVQFVLISRAVKQASVLVDGAAQAPSIGLHAILVDVRAGLEVKVAAARMATDPEQQHAQIDVVADALFGTSTAATLAIDVAPAGSVVSVDGLRMGTTPLPTLRGLLPGEHIVVVEQKGFLPVTRRLIAAAEPLAIAVTLVVDPDAERVINSPLVPFVVAGVGGLVGLGGGVMMAIGAPSWILLQDTNAEIAAAVAANNGANDQAFARNIAALNRTSATAAADWQSTGQALVVSGAVAAGLGVAAIAGGVVWGTVLLTSPVDE